MLISCSQHIYTADTQQQRDSLQLITPEHSKHGEFTDFYVLEGLVMFKDHHLLPPSPPKNSKKLKPEKAKKSLPLMPATQALLEKPINTWRNIINLLSDQLREGKPHNLSQWLSYRWCLFGMRKHCYVSAVQSRIQGSVLVPHRNLNQPSLKQEKCITASFRQQSQLSHTDFKIICYHLLLRMEAS